MTGRAGRRDPAASGQSAMVHKSGSRGEAVLVQAVSEPISGAGPRGARLWFGCVIRGRRIHSSELSARLWGLRSLLIAHCGPAHAGHCGSELAREDGSSTHKCVVDVLTSSRASSLPQVPYLNPGSRVSGIIPGLVLKSIPLRREACRAGQAMAAVQLRNLRHVVVGQFEVHGFEVAFQVLALGRRRNHRIT
jgi:hypothetical protein